MRIWIVIAVLAGLGAWRLPAQTPETAVEQAMRGYAATLKDGTPEQIAAFYAKDGELLLPGLADLKGPEAIRAFLAPIASAVAVESVAVTTDLVQVHGDSADLWGTYRQVAGEKGKPKQTYGGRYAALWHREADGKWRLSPAADAAGIGGHPLSEPVLPRGHEKPASPGRRVGTAFEISVGGRPRTGFRGQEENEHHERETCRCLRRRPDGAGLRSCLRPGRLGGGLRLGRRAGLRAAAARAPRGGD